ncbi:HemK/PrmC family methyltransferase [Devosia sp.]|uniref:N5-glutamine methyltransferase family protein n=1 Tax=Devosia sp. TaxID=1871048 RepID=UPI0032641422
MWRQWRDMLVRLGFPTAALDAKLLAGAAFGLSSLQMATREGERVTPGQVEVLAGFMQRRLSGEPVARILGEKEFYGLNFRLNGATLVPRPDTELLVDLALEAIRERAAIVLDLGTGTGCIPIAILANAPNVQAVAVDLSAEALECAAGNAHRNGLEDRLTLLQGSWFEPLVWDRLAFGASGSPPPLSPPHKGEGDDEHQTPGLSLPPLDGEGPGVGWGRASHATDKSLLMRGGGSPVFDLILSNPPYIETAVIDTLATDVRDFDPLLALDGGPDGLAPYRIIAAEARTWLKPGGQLLVEIGGEQGAAVMALLEAAGFADVTVFHDLAGLDRVVRGTHLER